MNFLPTIRVIRDFTWLLCHVLAWCAPPPILLPFRFVINATENIPLPPSRLRR